MKVLKFGGASIKDADGVKNLLEVLKTTNNDKEIVIVVSAMGKITRKLIKVVDNYLQWNEDDYDYAYDPDEDDEFDDYDDEISWNSRKLIEQFHYEIMSKLFSKDHIVFKEIENYFEEIKRFFIKNKEKEVESFVYDQIISFGELISSKIIYHYLKDNGFDLEWLDARELIKTNKNYGNADVDIKETEKRIIQKINKTKNYITQGFIGSYRKGKTTTLGFEGSDYSAALFANALEVESVTIWKDVAGVFNADPRYFRDYLVGEEKTTFENTKEEEKYKSLQAYGPLFLIKPILLDRLSYNDAAKMTRFGASVIHPKTIQPLQEKGIPLLVKSFLNPKEPGTEISNREYQTEEYQDSDTYTKSSETPYFMVKESIDIVEIYKKDNAFINATDLAAIIALFDLYNCKVELLQNTGDRVLICFQKNEERFYTLKRTIYNLGYSISHLLMSDSKPVLITILNPNPKVIKQVLTHISSEKILMRQSSEEIFQLVVEYDNRWY